MMWHRGDLPLGLGPERHACRWASASPSTHAKTGSTAPAGAATTGVAAIRPAKALALPASNATTIAASISRVRFTGTGSHASRRLNSHAPIASSTTA
jgi:hypothetical protein